MYLEELTGSITLENLEILCLHFPSGPEDLCSGGDLWLRVSGRTDAVRGRGVE